MLLWPKNSLEQAPGATAGKDATLRESGNLVILFELFSRHFQLTCPLRMHLNTPVTEQGLRRKYTTGALNRNWARAVLINKFYLVGSILIPQPLQ